MPSTVYLRNGAWAARVTISGRQVWLGTFEAREDAEEAVRREKLKVRQGHRRVPAFTVSEWGAIWQELYPGRRNEQTAAHNAQMVAPFVRCYGDRRLRSITPLEAQQWALSSPASVRYLRLMWGKAGRAGAVFDSPWDSVEVIPRQRVQLVPSIAAVELLVDGAYARGWQAFGDCIVFAAYSGLRVSEVADVQAGDVLADGRRVLVRGKRRAGEVEPRARTAAVFGAGREALLRQAPEVGSVWLSPTGRRLTRGGVAKSFRLVADDVGFGGSFHSLRRFHATWLRDRGADPRDIAQQLGHVDRAGRPYPEMVDRVYAHPSADMALARLEAVAG